MCATTPIIIDGYYKSAPDHCEDWVRHSFSPRSTLLSFSHLSRTNGLDSLISRTILALDNLVISPWPRLLVFSLSALIFAVTHPCTINLLTLLCSPATHVRRPKGGECISSENRLVNAQPQHIVDFPN